MASIELRNVGVEFPIYMARGRSFKNAVLRSVGGRIGNVEDTGRISVQSLKDISFSLQPGDRLALVGPNGAGKSTLLRVLSGVYEPSEGQIRVVGNISSLLDVSLGIDPEMTGNDNIILRSVLLGKTFEEARASIPKIAEFCELGDFLDLPMRTYSQGMALRLAFGVSTSVAPDIVLLDEMVGVGDASFAQKAEARLDALIANARILVLSSHDGNALRKFCNKGAWLQGGKLRAIGALDDVLDQYADAVNSPSGQDS